MADLGYIESQLTGIADPALRKVLLSVFKYLLKDVRFGRAEDAEASVNFGGGFFEGTTPATPNEEFSIEHSFGRPPYLLIPVLPLDAIGANIVPLQMERAADSRKIYLSSSVASANFVVYVEG
jgi:hypothetical protein